MEEQSKSPKLICVCSHKNCRWHENSPVIEFNFADAKIYWKCPSCNKMNEMSIKPPPIALPRSRTI